MRSALILLWVAMPLLAHPPAQPARRGPPIDLVAAPPQVLIPFPRFISPFWGGFGYYPGVYLPGYYQIPQVFVPPQAPPLLPPLSPARVTENTDRAAAEVSATLTLTLPAAADVWLNGDKLPSSADPSRTLTSPPLRIGEGFTFRVRAEWVEEGVTYETAQVSSVRAGERGKLTVYAGTRVK